MPRLAAEAERPNGKPPQRDPPGRRPADPKELEHEPPATPERRASRERFRRDVLRRRERGPEPRGTMRPERPGNMDAVKDASTPPLTFPAGEPRPVSEAVDRPARAAGARQERDRWRAGQPPRDVERTERQLTRGGGPGAADGLGMIPEPARQPLDVDMSTAEAAAANGGVEAPGVGSGGSLDPDVLDAI